MHLPSCVFPLTRVYHQRRARSQGCRGHCTFREFPERKNRGFAYHREELPLGTASDFASARSSVWSQWRITMRYRIVKGFHLSHVIDTSRCNLFRVISWIPSTLAISPCIRKVHSLGIDKNSPDRPALSRLSSHSFPYNRGNYTTHNFLPRTKKNREPRVR